MTEEVPEAKAERAADLLRPLSAASKGTEWGTTRLVARKAAEMHGVLADGVGFEPTNPCGLAVFKTAAFNRSATHPPVATQP